MKRIFILYLLLAKFLSFGQGLETFTNIPTASSSSYQTRNWVGDNSISWTATDARTDQTINGKAILIRNGYLESQSTINNGIGSLTITTQRKFGTSAEDGNLTVYINGNSVGTVPFSGTITTSTISNINLSGPITIKVSKEGNSFRCAIDDLYWTSYTVSSNDSDSKVDGPTLSLQPDPILVSSLADSDPEVVRVFDFDIWDLGTTDGLPTKVTSVTIQPGTNNTANWANTIAGAKLSKDGGTTFVTTGTPVITASSIVFPISSGNLDIANSDAETVSLYIYLKNSGLVDNSVLEFKIPATLHGFTADATGSQFATTMVGATSNDMLIDVVATELRFVQQPSNTNVNVVMTPPVTVQSTDVNGNRDLDFSSSVSITSIGTLAGSPVVSAAINGLATFSTLIHTAMGNGLTLTAERDGSFDWDVISNQFSIMIMPSASDVRINELDADQTGTDTQEFIELFGTPNFDLTGLAIVFFNGNGDISYYSTDLDGKTLDGNGYFILGNAGAPGNPDIIFTNDLLQNGADAVALYFANASDFPNGTPVTSTNLIDALVYDTDDADDTGLLSGLNQTEQINENLNSQSATQSIQRGSWFVAAPTPRAVNSMPVILVNYKVQAKGKITDIIWSTSSETNSSHFIIEWSRDANEWNEIGTVKASGTTHDIKEYTFIHENPKAGINYYRLTQVDFDGRKETFPVKSVYFGSNQRNFDIVPNLAFNNVKIEFEKPVENGRLHIYNIDGQLMQSYVLASGIDVLRIDVSELPTGQYIAKYIDGEDTINRKFIKQ